MPLCAGPETSVAATKSYIASLAAIVHLVASWTQDRELHACARAGAGPARTGLAARLERRARAPCARPAVSFVVGRGLGLGIAQEAALKLKETCGLHAEAFSAAEVRHGPMALVGEGFPVLALAAARRDTRGSRRWRATSVARRRRRAWSPGPKSRAQSPADARAHPAIEPLLMTQSFYRLANALALARGLDPDRPAAPEQVHRDDLMPARARQRTGAR